MRDPDPVASLDTSMLTPGAAVSALPVRAQPLAFSELTHVPAANAPLAAPGLLGRERTGNPLHQVKTKLTVCIGTIELSVGELLGAKERQVLRLDHAVDHPVDVLLEGQVVARGTLVAVDDSFGVCITELPRALTP